jgi:creatinine amidohydrolase
LGSKPNEIDPTIVQTKMGHACEWETSMILHLAPGLVGDVATIEPVSPAMPFEPAAQGWITHERSKAGHIGDPARASAAKGQRLFEIFARDVVAFLERVVAWDGRAWNG